MRIYRIISEGYEIYPEKEGIHEVFDVLPQLAENELLKRGVMTDELLYCVKADLDGDGGYVDVYITFTKDTLCILRGYEEYGKMKRGQKRKIS